MAKYEMFKEELAKLEAYAKHNNWIINRFYFIQDQCRLNVSKDKEVLGFIYVGDSGRVLLRHKE